MLHSIKKLYEAGILAPRGVYRLLTSLLTTGVNPMALLSYAAKCEPHSNAVTDERGTVTYAELHEQSMHLAGNLQREYHIAARQKVAIICRNHAALVRALFAVSCLGAHVYLLNVEMSQGQLAAIIKQQGFDLVICDEGMEERMSTCGYTGKCITAYGGSGSSVEMICRAARPNAAVRVVRVRAGNIVVLSGGTTGDHKVVARKPGVARFVRPFCALLVNAELSRYTSVYIATPAYHGYGLAALFVSVLLRSHVYLQQRFDAGKTCAFIKDNNIEVATVVPLMLHRMLECDVAALGSLKCIISGGAPISAPLVRRTLDRLGPVLYNLYGTSEAGICIMATPADLEYAADTVGRSIAGVQLRVVGAHGSDVAAGVKGKVCIKNSWSMTNARDTWIDTGDVGYRDERGYVFLCGRADDMIVSGGENVYPAGLEHVLLQYEGIREAAVIGVRDEVFGQRLWAFVVPESDADINESMVRAWLQGRVARYEMPAQVDVVSDLPYTALGKVDKNKLRSYHDAMQ